MLKKRIPTIVGLFLLLVGVVGGVIFINQGTNFLPRAAPEYIPQKVKITNITDTGFVVSWITTEPSVGFIKYSDNPVNLSKTSGDDRDQLSGSRGEYRTHYVTLQNLNPTSTYYFKIGSQKDQLYDNNGQPFDQVLPAKISQKPALDTIYGTVLTSVDTPAEGAIIYLAIDNATPLSTLVKQNGNWAADLSMVRSTDQTAYAVYDPQTTRLDMLIQSNEGEQTTAVTTTANDQPVPTIVLGKTNNFVPETTPTPTPTPSPTPTPTVTYEPTDIDGQAPSLSSSKFDLTPLTAVDNNTVSITSIPQSGLISSPQPELKGTAPPNTALTITVHSPVAHTGSVVADKNGQWHWLVPSPLESGEHVATISYTDTQGKVHSFQKTFTVAAISLQPVDLAYGATPSATPKPTPTPKPSPSPTPKPSATPLPSPTPRTTVASGSANIVAGTTSTSVIIIAFGICLIGFGLGYKKLFPSR